jgi:hypothetical protein
MNLRTTLLLILLAVGGAAAYVNRDAIAARLGHAPRTAESPSTLYILRNIRPDSITRVDVSQDGQTVELVREGKAWSLPGGWPTRGPEVQELIDKLTGLDSRFDPIPVGTGSDLHPYGLDPLQKPVGVTLTVPGSGPDKTLTFKLFFGEPPERSGNPFTRPTYFKLEGQDQVLATEPGLLRVLKRTKDDYRKRQLFPDVERARVGDPRPSFPGEPEAAQPTVNLIDARRIQITGPEGAWTLARRANAAPRKPGAEITAERLADEWDLAEPVPDRVDPDKLRGALAAVPDLWVENFVGDVDPNKTGLTKPERTLKVETNKRTVEIQIGAVSREVEKKAPPPPPPPFGQPPQPPPPPIKEVYRFAKLAGNPQVFEVKADKIGDLFVAPAALRDARLARFRSADARRVEIAHADVRIVLANERDESAKEDHWKLVQPVKAEADAAKITELLDRLSELKATGPDVIDKADPKTYGLDAATGPRLVVELSEEVPGGEEKVRQPRSLTIRLGRHDTDKNKLYVQLAGNPRVVAVGDEFLKLFDRPALAYRGRRVIDVAANKVATIAIKRPGDEFKLEQANGVWKLQPPGADAARLAATDAGKASTLVNDLSRLEVSEYVNDTPTPEELAKYGLTTPTLSATLTFIDAGQPAKSLELGKPREGKPEVYAKLADSPAVFAVREAIKTTLDQPSLAYRPTTLWQLTPEGITAIEVQRGDEKYRLTREGAAWKLSGPFDAPAATQAAQAIVAQIAAPRVERYEAHAASDPTKFGLDKPELRVTVFTAAGEPKGLAIGKPAAADVKSRFARTNDGDAVVVVPEALAKAADRTALDLIDPDLLSLNVNLIAAARGHGPGGDWEVTRDGADWKVGTPPMVADRFAIEGLLRPWADLRAERFVAYGPQTDWAKFGLDKPAATVSIMQQTPPETHLLSIGNVVEQSDARYARVDDKPGVVVLPAAVAHDLIKSPLDFTDRKIFAFDPSELVAIRRTGSAGELEIARANDGWKIVKPPPPIPSPAAGGGPGWRADQPALDELAERLGGLRAVRIAAADAKDLKEFGLDSPAATVTLVLKDKDGKPSEKVLRIGGVARPESSKGVVDGGTTNERFAQIGDSKAVVVLPAAVSTKLLAEPLKLRDRSVVRFTEADRIFIERGTRKVIFAKIDGAWKMTEPAAAEAEATELDELIAAVSRLRADELVADKPGDLKPFGLDAPEARVRFLAGDREVLNLLVGKRDMATGRHFAKLAAGDVVFFLSPDLSNRLLAEYRKRSLWTGLEAAGIETLVYSVGEQTTVLQKLNESWQVPGKPDQVVNVGTVNDLVSALAGLKVERYVADKGADLKLYGLQPAQRTIVARSRTGVTATLYLGKPEDGSKRVFGRILDANRSDVFLLSEAESARLAPEIKSFTK